jgi:hypothetical protein
MTDEELRQRFKALSALIENVKDSLERLDKSPQAPTM